MLRLAVIHLLFALAASQCPTDYVYYGGTNKCFLFVTGKYFTWDGAQGECQKTGGNLVSISNKEEDEYIANIYADLNEDRFPWIGLHRSPPAPNQGKYDGWAWVDGNNATYRRFENEYFYQNSTNAMLEYDEVDWTTTWDSTSKQPYICSAVPQFSPNCPLKPPCATGWTYLAETKACYKTFFNKDFHGAEQVCQQNGGHLAVVHDDLENDFVGGLAETGIRQDELRQIWLGIYRVNSTSHWITVDGSEERYTNFGRGLPDNIGGSENCIQMFADPWAQKVGYQYQWNDINCEMGLRAFVCKKMSM